TSSDFPVVGIGASAGGLDAYERLFTTMPPDTGLAFIIVQHLDPNRESMLVELLERFTAMHVSQVVDGVRIEPNHVYIIPPNRNLAIKNGKLYLMELKVPRGMRLPIDFFFRSLADDLGERAICIILSGTGSDGTLGLKAIKEGNGLALVQAPETAAYDGMPHSAIATGLVDLVLEPEDIPAHLVGYVEHAFQVRHLEQEAEQRPAQQDFVEKIFIILRSRTGHDFSSYKPNTIRRRIERRMAVNQIEKLSSYVRFLQENTREIDILFKDLLIGVTSFFRDDEAWKELEQVVIPDIVRNRSGGDVIRVWVPGCSTGEEAYSIAILLTEHLQRHKLDIPVQIFATDIDQEAIDKARLGKYSVGIVADVSQERLQRFFRKEDNAYEIDQHLRDMVVFAHQSVIKDPPFSRIDLLSCRNLLIYLDSELQERVLPLFHYALRPDGYLFLGTSETLGKFETSFRVVNRKLRLFQRLETGSGLQAATLNFGPPSLPQRAEGLANLQRNQITVGQIAVDTLMEYYTPPCIVIDDHYQILYFHQSTGKYLQPPSGEPTYNVLQMARPGLRVALHTATRRARKERKEVFVEDVVVQTNGDSQTIDLVVRPIRHPALQVGLLMVLFRDKVATSENSEKLPPPAQESDGRIVDLEHELRSTRQYLQTTVEELETSNEELQSTNEELQSSNEELQSTNEELQTAKEELQSVNEELLTVNAELERKIVELTRANNDLSNLLASLSTAVIFLDRGLKVQRFNRQAQQLVNLISSDVGRPLQHIVSNLKIQDLIISAAEHVLETLETVVEDVETESGEWYRMNARVYRGERNDILGVLISFNNITQERWQDTWRRTLERAVDQAASYIIIANADGKVEYINEALANRNGWTLDTLELLEQIPSVTQHSPEFFGDIWEQVRGGTEWQGEICVDDLINDEARWVAASVTPVRSVEGSIERYIVILEDISKRVEAEIELRSSERLHRMLARNLPETAVLIFDHDLRYLIAEGPILEDIGYSTSSLEGNTLADVAPQEAVDTLTPL
ncbi:MAG: PAS domain-containing protein, partial [Chloroflexi bacterium]|nr:PAS domain-containing protein [Chloroflexota bacterium]